jgi:hypothetical protein
MNCLAWNCRGLGNPRTVQELARLVRAKDPTVVFLIETWQDEGPLERLRCRLQFANKFVTNSRNKGGGLCMFWKQEINLRVQSFSPSHIDVIINDTLPEAWRLTGFYGAPATQDREASWNLLRRLKSQSNLPWCCMGDFNELVRLEEKQGRLGRSDRQMQLFRDVLDECSFVDLGFTGPSFTWTNNRVGDMTWERLDRAVATPDWLLRFPSIRVHHLEAQWSDHKPLWVTSDPMMTPHRKPFRFEEVWTSNPGCEEAVAESWRSAKQGAPMHIVVDKIRACRRGLRAWSKNHFGSIRKQISEVELLLQQAEAMSMRGINHGQYKHLKGELQALQSKEERLWRQRSRAEWLKAGDQNTRYFHCRATQRKRRNQVHRLKDPNGVWTTSQGQVSQLFVNYYSSLFTTSNPALVDPVVENIMPSVTTTMNSMLVSDFTADEVVQALKQMAPLKAPGPDGLPPVFYQNYWHLIGEDVIAAVLGSLNSGKILRAINHTYVTLIPKVKNPEVVTEFRPISLCNVIYKIISKVLANRLKTILPQIVSESQSAFVPGRLITDNILVAFETLHYMQHQKTGKTGSMALKLDMSKAYDRVEWPYLKSVMERMGFHAKWISIIMECISTVSYSILVNGEPHGYIQPTRGLRQGDPLSPYLFLLCAEGLHSLIHKAKLAGVLQGVSISRGGPKITHLFFADDSLLFCKAKPDDVARIQAILNEYEQASGQEINRQKTTIFFSKSTPHRDKEIIQDMLGVPAIKQYEKYLGLPSFIGRAKYSTFAQIKERVWSKIKGWKEKLMSQAGREILIKSVAQAIPTYAMSCFRLPKRLIQEIEVLIRRFWWGQGGDRNKMHWLSWDTLCKSKANGGLGFRGLEFFNEALLAKQVWRLLHNKTSLFYKVFKHKYFPRCSILEASQNSRGSYAWKSILGARNLIVKGSIWRVGSGNNIPIWGSRWLPSTPHHRVISPRPPHTTLTVVRHLMDDRSNTWNEDIVTATFLPFEADIILKIPLSQYSYDDTLIWGGTKNGAYAVRSGYHLLLHESHSAEPGPSNTSLLTNVWNTIWSLKVPPKVRHFLWRASHESLPTRQNLHRRHILDDPVCITCNSEPETIIHILWLCSTSQNVWQSVLWSHKLTRDTYSDFQELLLNCVQNLTLPELQLFAMLSWSLWYRRNCVRLNKPVEAITSLLPRTKELLQEYIQVQESPSPTQKQVIPQLQSRGSVCWRPPEMGRVKINYDGAVFTEMGAAGVGVIIRNSQGAVMASLSQRILFPYSVEAVEAIAARAAVQLALDLGFRTWNWREIRSISSRLCPKQRQTTLSMDT